jgi:serine/threonine protein kinase
MALTIGTQLGSHEITALLGKGGMGEVYRARETKLKREVAIKILPEEFSRDEDRVSRFQRKRRCSPPWTMFHTAPQLMKFVRRGSTERRLL